VTLRGPRGRLGAFAAVLVAVFAAALTVGRVVGADDARSADAPAHGHADGGASDGDHASGGRLPGASPNGLAAVGAGYRMVVVSAVAAGAQQAFELAFRIDDGEGRVVRDYVVTHERPLHLVLARDDLSAEVHVHPQLGDDGVWRVELSLPSTGRWRAIADFVPAGRDGALALGVDLLVPGPSTIAALPAPAREASVDGYDVALVLDEPCVAGDEAQLSFRVRRGGTVVDDLDPHLGARGHLLILRDGDLAYLHVHPLDDGALDFAATFPSAGSYRMYLEFSHGGSVHTAAFTVEVGS
jgi:hypothetical protein